MKPYILASGDVVAAMTAENLGKLMKGMLNS